MYTHASAPLLLCMHVHMNDQMTTTEQDIVGPGELYIVYAILVLYIPSTYLSSPLLQYYILYIYIYNIIYAQIIPFTPPP